MKKFLKSNNGITLVALVVTIIVLLILAGVSLNLVAGSNGILNRASNAVNSMNLAKIKEELELKIAELQLDYYSESSLQSTYTSANAYVKAQLSKESGIVLPSGVMIKADSDGNLLYEETQNIGTLNADGTITINGIESGSGITPQTKYTVTYNGNGGSNAPTDSTRYNNGDTVTVNFSTTPTRTGYNFLGWATSSSAKEPVYIGSGSFAIKGNTTLYAVWNPIQSYHAQHPELHIPTGFSHIEGTVDEGYVIRDSEGNEFVWIPVANDEAYSKKLGTNNWRMKQGSTGDDPAESLGTIANAVKGDKLGVTNILGTTVADAITAQQPEYPVVKAAGGFWVGRYEAGVASVARSENLAVTKWNSDPGITVKKGNEPARYIYQSQCLNIANNWKSDSANAAAGTVAFKSGLITGSQWDAMCNFIGWNIADNDCSSWGNCANTAGQAYTGYHSNDAENDWVSNTITKGTSNNRFIFPTAAFKTSANRDTAQKNIYDVAGNVWEWTTEIPQYSEANAVVRGCSASNNGSLHWASYRDGSWSATTGAVWFNGFRIVLYVE